MTPFSFEHAFLAANVSDVFDAYFDPRLLIEQDRAVGIIERQVLELCDEEDEIVRRCRVVPRRQLPAVLRPFATGPLHYVEEVRGRRKAGEILIDLRLLGDRARVRGTYELRQPAPGSVLRRYFGHVSVDVALVAGRVERGIVAEFERSLARAAACTQNWLSSQTQLTVAARA
jgi:hypothetical protein